MHKLWKWCQAAWPGLLILAIGFALISPYPELSIRRLVLSPTAATETRKPIPETEPALPPGWSRFVTLIDKFGEAMIIAGSLALAFERRARKVVLEEISRDAINVMVGWKVPAEVEETAKDILHLKFERRGFVQHYEFRLAPVGSPRQHLAVTSTTEYELTNLTNARSFFDFKSSIESSTGKGLPENRLLLMQSPDVAIIGDELDARTTVDGPYKRAVTSVWIPPKGHARFVTRRLAHYDRNGSLVLDILEPPAIGVKVTIEAPEAFQFRISFGANGEAKPSRKGTRWEWEHPGVFLPGSHYRVQWEEQT